MNYHSDQALDLETGSYIALFSCYERPEELAESAQRTLKVKSKTRDEEFGFSLENNSVVLFSLTTNTNFQHKIVLESPKGAKPTHPSNRWLGITFRQSKTFVRFEGKLPYLSNGELLTLADESLSKEFYTLRGEENNSVNFVYPHIAYTLSIGDTLLPIGL